MSNNNYKVCACKGCPNLTKEKYCPECTKLELKKQQSMNDQIRGSAASRGYNRQWHKGRQSFFNQPENQFCYIKGPECLGLANAKEHIVPPEGPNDPLFYDKDNFGAACVPCNSWKNHRSIQQLARDEKIYYDSIGYSPIEELESRKTSRTQDRR